MVHQQSREISESVERRDLSDPIDTSSFRNLRGNKERELRPFVGRKEEETGRGQGKLRSLSFYWTSDFHRGRGFTWRSTVSPVISGILSKGPENSVEKGRCSKII